MSQDKVCGKCKKSFVVSNEEADFLTKIGPIVGTKRYAVTLPTLCPDCRAQRRMSFRNERKLYSRKCDLCKKDMVSLYSPDKKFTVYCAKCWWNDGWDPYVTGMDFDFNRPFFEQIAELWRKTPVVGLWNLNSENSDYNNNSTDLKDSYMNFNSDFSQNIFYNYMVEFCNDVVDSLSVFKSQFSYECIDCRNVYGCFYSKDLENSQDCYFSSDLIGCRNCFGSHGLRHKKNYIYNQKVTPEQYKVFMEKLVLTPEIINQYRKKSDEVRLKIPHQYARKLKCENSEGDHLYGCKNVQNGFDVLDDSENMANVFYCPYPTKNVRDAYAFGGLEWAYEFLGGGIGVNNVAFVNNTMHGLSDSFYTILCLNGSKNLFGCVGLKKGEYAILNKQYSKEEYEALVPKIIEHMKKTGEWGEYFPSSICPYGYNETIAQEHYPLGKEQALAQGFNWCDYEQPKPNIKLIKTDEIPSKIEQVNDDILNSAIECEVSKRLFRIVKYELDFYRKYKLPIPRRHPDQRHLDRLAIRNPSKLFGRKCAKCSMDIKSTFAPDRPEIVYCEKCYLVSIY